MVWSLARVKDSFMGPDGVGGVGCATAVGVVVGVGRGVTGAWASGVMCAWASGVMCAWASGVVSTVAGETVPLGVGEGGTTGVGTSVGRADRVGRVRTAASGWLTTGELTTRRASPGWNPVGGFWLQDAVAAAKPMARHSASTILDHGKLRMRVGIVVMRTCITFTWVSE